MSKHHILPCTHTHTQKFVHAHIHRPVVTCSDSYSQHNQWLGNHSVRLEGIVYCQEFA